MPAPRLVRPGDVHRGSDAELRAELERLGGVPPMVLEYPELLDVVLRTARADYRLAETYRARPDAALHTPVTTHRGLADPELTAAEAEAWAGATTGECVHRTFPGDHFHAAADPAPVVADLAAALVSAVSAP
ncbi:hypothetical protein GCM10020000_76450 [Streptomyces olivoverticillatus]